MTVQITILGLGKIGSSVGLALSDELKQVIRVGHDVDHQTAQASQKMGAVDKVERNLFKAIEGTDILVLAIPVDQVIETLDLVKNDLREDTVILDMAPIKQTTIEWVDANLPEKVFYLSMMPTINANLFDQCATGIEAANKDLFKKSYMVIASPKRTESDAISLASNLAMMLGAAPFYADGMESDGLATGSHVVPQLIAAAMMNSLSKQSGWLEGRKVAGHNFYHNTLPLLHLDDKVRLGESIIHNQENVVRQLDLFIQELIEQRDALKEKDLESLAKILENARDERDIWLSRRTENNWEVSKSDVTMPSAKDMFGQLFGLGKRRKEKR
ncbi:MAG: prephenate dehydrogenase [Anaerolineaceae bacterium]|nr:prephenate dehydrogenase [Anaerolineaceae bacterium]